MKRCFTKSSQIHQHHTYIINPIMVDMFYKNSWSNDRTYTISIVLHFQAYLFFKYDDTVFG